MNEKLFSELMKSVEQAGKISRNEMKPKRQFLYENIDVRAIRTKVGLTQAKFALMVGVPLRTLQNWEQGHRKPEGPALALLTIFKNDPKHAFMALYHK